MNHQPSSSSGLLSETPLFMLWQRCTGKSPSIPPAHQWQEETRMLYELGIGMEETIRFLYSDKPSLEAFEDWLKQRSKVPFTHEGIEHLFRDSVPASSFIEDTLTSDDLEFWKRNGYVILKNVIPTEQCKAAREAIWNFMNASADEPETWYSMHQEQRGMMLMFYHHPALEEIRQSARIRKAYEQLYGHTRLYATMDKVSFNPPERPGYSFKGSPLHWDVSLHLPIPLAMQGLLYLNDVTETGGAFHCVPGFHHAIEGWLNSIPEGSNPRDMAIQLLKPVAIPGNAGDFIIWHQALPHCATPNRDATPRMVQYLTYLPLKKAEETVWI